MNFGFHRRCRKVRDASFDFVFVDLWLDLDEGMHSLLVDLSSIWFLLFVSFNYGYACLFCAAFRLFFFLFLCAGRILLVSTIPIPPRLLLSPLFFCMFELFRLWVLRCDCAVLVVVGNEGILFV